MVKKMINELNNAQKSIAALVGVLLCIDLLPAAAALQKNPALPAALSLGAQVLFVLFVYYALLWLKRE